MMRQVQRKSAATRANATTVRSPSWPIRRVGTLLSTSSGSGAGLRDLMARMGHDSERAAMIYQHEARGADQLITSAIDAHVQSEQHKDGDGPGEVLTPAG
jgi:hypothetical protein